MAMIEPLDKPQLDELFVEIDRRMETASTRLRDLWTQHRGHARQQLRHRTGARTTGTLVAVPAPETYAEVRLRVQGELANATLAASQAGQAAQRAVDHLGNAMSIEREARKSSPALIAIPGEDDRDP